MHIGTVLQGRRKELDITITAAASLGEVSRPYLSMVEAGKRLPNPQTLVRLTRALDISSDVWVPALLEGERRCQRLIELGQALFLEADYRAARRVLSCALFISRRERDGRYNRDIYHTLGRIHLEQDRYMKALRWFRLLERAAQHGADLRLQAVAQYNVGLTLAKMERTVDAARKLGEAAEGFGRLHLQHGLASSTLQRANVLLAMRLYPQARTEYRRAAHLLRSKPLYDDALLGEAITTWRLRGPKTALPMLRKIVDSRGTTDRVRAKARCNMSGALREIGLYGEALHEIETALVAREGIPAELVAALLTEATLCHLLKHDARAAGAALLEYSQLDGAKDGQDIAAMHILASALNAGPLKDEIPSAVEDAHEKRIVAALQILQQTPYS